MTTPIEQVYFTWLCNRVDVPHDKSCSDLLGQLHSKEFVWIVPNDDNRIQDGVDLRYEFVHENALEENNAGLLMGIPPISVLEVLIALSNRLAFQVEGQPEEWVWMFIKNLDLAKMVDPVSPRMGELIDDTLNDFIWRNYGTNGDGGIFPLKHPKDNQTKVELWYQMAAWIEENFDH